MLFSLLPIFLIFHIAVGANVDGFLLFPSKNLTSLDLEHTSIELQEITEEINRSPIQKNTHLHQDGTFIFKDIPTGSYLLTLSSFEYNWAPFKTKITVLENGEVKANTVTAGSKWKTDGIEIPVPITAVLKSQLPQRLYIQNRSPGILESGPIATVLNSPLYLLGILLVILAVGLPYIIEKVDPEAAKLMKEQKEARKKKTSAAAMEAADKLTNFDVGAAVGKLRAADLKKD